MTSTTTSTWADGDGDTLTVAPMDRHAAFVSAPDLVFLTADQCREVAAHLTALADHHDHKETPVNETTPADPHHDPRPWQECTREDIREGDLVEALNGDHLRIGVAHHQNKYGSWCTEVGYLLTYGDRWPLRRIPAHTTEKETTMTENTPAAPSEPLARTLLAVPAGHGAPHHDMEKIEAGDYVLQVDKDGTLRAGRARHQDKYGNWHAEGGKLITWAYGRADRPDAITVWPAPVPPAVEVEMPGEFGAVILNPRWGTRSYTRAVHLGEGVWAAEITPGENVYTYLLSDLRSATLIDGTHARRDGNHEDGTPRFVKVREGEK